MKTSPLRQLVILPLLMASMALLHACSTAAGRAGAASDTAAAWAAAPKTSLPSSPAASGSKIAKRAVATPGVATPATITREVVLTQGATVILTPAVRPGNPDTPNQPARDASAPQLTLERINDSRCRQGMVCVWAGYISYSFVLTGPEGRSNFVLSENMPNTSASTTQQGWTITLTGLEPQAAPAKNENAPQYRVSLRVSNAPSS